MILVLSFLFPLMSGRNTVCLPIVKRSMLLCQLKAFLFLFFLTADRMKNMLTEEPEGKTSWQCLNSLRYVKHLIFPVVMLKWVNAPLTPHSLTVPVSSVCAHAGSIPVDETPNTLRRKWRTVIRLNQEDIYHLNYYQLLH